MYQKIYWLKTDNIYEDCSFITRINIHTNSLNQLKYINTYYRKILSINSKEKEGKSIKSLKKPNWSSIHLSIGILEKGCLSIISSQY